MLLAVSAPLCDAEKLVYPDASGTATEPILADPATEPAGRLILDQPKLPAGAWALANTGLAPSFEGVDPAAVQWSARGRPLVA